MLYYVCIVLMRVDEQATEDSGVQQVVPLITYFSQSCSY
jgi:hypothetical protein